MRSLLVLGVVSAAILTLPAFAAPTINGQINFAGNDTFDPATTTITFINPADVLSTSGSFNAFGNCIGCVTFKTPVDYGAFNASTNAVTGTNGGVSFAIDLLTETTLLSTPTGVDFQGSTLLHLTGFADTAGEFFFSTQGPAGTEVTFSSTANAVPEPAALGLMGVGLLGLGLVRARRL